MTNKIAAAIEALYGPAIVNTVPPGLLAEPDAFRSVNQFDVVVVTSESRGPVPELGFVLDFEDGGVLVGILNDPEALVLPFSDLTVVASTSLAEQVRRAHDA